MTDRIETGPDLYRKGVELLGYAERQSESDISDDPEIRAEDIVYREQRTQSLAAMAQAAFAGAQAAALGALGADEAESKELAQAWRDVIGDDPGPDISDNPDSEAETTDGE